MLSVLLCIVALATTYSFAKRKLSRGLICVLIWGYAYGIARANLASFGAHFMFDCAVLGLYCAHLSKLFDRKSRGDAGTLRAWVVILAIWPMLLTFIPFQPIEVTLVGLRANIFFLPILLFGSQLRNSDLNDLASSVAVLDLAALTIGGAEYFLGIERFYPRNALTELIYNMHDVAGYTAYRIPGTFSSPAAYAGTMVQTLPLLYGGWVQRKKGKAKSLLFCGLIAALLGVLLSASRSAFIVMLLAVVFTLTGNVAMKKRVLWYMGLLCICLLTATNERLQRFTTLRDTDYVESRIAGSVNRSFWEILWENPMGNGLGGGGTSIPYFWEGHVRRPVGLESEYSRIMLEQTVIGLLLWVGFIQWLFTRSKAFVNTPWREGRRLAWFVSLTGFAGGLIGIGVFTAVPQTVLMFLMTGWFSVRPFEPIAGHIIVRPHVRRQVMSRTR